MNEKMQVYKRGQRLRWSLLKVGARERAYLYGSVVTVLHFWSAAEDYLSTSAIEIAAGGGAVAIYPVDYFELVERVGKESVI